jgi:hypothetical protein
MNCDNVHGSYIATKHFIEAVGIDRIACLELTRKPAPVVSGSMAPQARRVTFPPDQWVAENAERSAKGRAVLPFAR